MTEWLRETWLARRVRKAQYLWQSRGGRPVDARLMLDVTFDWMIDAKSALCRTGFHAEEYDVVTIANEWVDQAEDAMRRRDVDQVRAITLPALERIHTILVRAESAS